MAIWSSGAGNNGIWAPDPLYGGIWASDMQRAISRAFITDNGGTTLLNASTGYINPNVTFSRASNGMVCDQDGNWTWTSLPYRRSFDVMTKEWGYLFEPQRTNVAPNAALVDYSAGLTSIKTPITRGGLSGWNVKVAGIATQIWAWFRSGDASNGVWHTIQQSTTPITHSAYLKPIKMQSTTLALEFASRNSTTSVQRSGTLAITSEGRYQATQIAGDFDQASVGAMVTNMTIGAQVDIEFEVWGMQLETGPIATSPIATSGAQVTVAADVCTYANNVLTDAAGTVLARVYAPAYQGNRPVLSSSTWDSNSYWLGYQFGPNPIARGGGTGPGAGLLGTPDNSTLLMSYNGTGRTLVSGTQGEVTGAGAATTPESTLYIGQDGLLNGHINHLSVFPTQLDAPKRATAASFTKF